MAESVVFAIGVEADGLAEFILHLIASGEGAGEGAADADVLFSSRRAPEHGVEGD